MSNRRIVSVLLTLAALVLSLSLTAACSSSDGDGGDVADGDGQQAAAASDSSGEGGAEAATDMGAGYKLTQTFEMSTIEITSDVFSRIRRLKIDYTCHKQRNLNQQGEWEVGLDKSPPMKFEGVPRGHREPRPDNGRPRRDRAGGRNPPGQGPLGAVEPASGHDRASSASGDDDRARDARPQRPAGDERLRHDRLHRAMPDSGHPLHIPERRHVRPDVPTSTRGFLCCPTATRSRSTPSARSSTCRPGATKDELLQAMDGHIIAGGEVVAEYRPKALLK